MIYARIDANNYFLFKMIEKRAIISSIKRTRKTAEEIGGKFKSNYLFKDIIFSEKTNQLSKKFIRVRILYKNNGPVKKITLILRNKSIKKAIMKKEFNKLNDALKLIKNNMPKFKKIFEYKREGWQYSLNKSRIFIEKIEKYYPTVEIESNKKKEIDILFKKFKIIKILKESVPETMYKFHKQKPF